MHFCAQNDYLVMASSLLFLQLVLLLNPAATAFPEIIEFALFFMPSKLCLENQGLWGLAWERPKLVHRIYPANPNQRQLACDLILFLFFCGWCSSLCSYLQARGYLKWVIYLFMHFYYHKNQIATFKKTCLWRVGGSQQIEVRERGLHLYQKTTSN